MKYEEIENEWLNRAGREEDPYYKFICAFITLNFLYGNRRAKGDSECEVMSAYLVERAKVVNWHMRDIDVSEYLTSPIEDMRRCRGASKVMGDDAESLFKAIYQVRCNLFHGNKELDSERDERLVRQGANVILSILTSVMTGNSDINQTK